MLCPRPSEGVIPNEERDLLFALSLPPARRGLPRLGRGGRVPPAPDLSGSPTGPGPAGKRVDRSKKSADRSKEPTRKPAV